MRSEERGARSEERGARSEERGASERRSRSSVPTASFQIRGKRHIRSPRCTEYTSYTTWAIRLSATSPCFYSWSAPVPCNTRRPVSPCRCSASTGRPRRPLQPRLRRPQRRRRHSPAPLPRMDPHVASRPSAAPAAACSARPRAGRTASSLRGSRHPSRWALRDTSVVLALGSFPACSRWAWHASSW